MFIKTGPCAGPQSTRNCTTWKWAISGTETLLIAVFRKEKSYAGHLSFLTGMPDTVSAITNVNQPVKGRLGNVCWAGE